MTTEIGDLLTDAFSRIRQTVGAAVDGLSPEQTGYRPDPDANSVAWLVWHLTRVQDSHISELAGQEQEWVTGDGTSGSEPLPSRRTRVMGIPLNK